MSKQAARMPWARFVAIALVVVPLAAATSNAAVEGDGAVVIFDVHDGAGQPLVSRVRVAPLDWSERLRLQMWRDLHHVASRGRAELPLAPGRYRVVVSRGPEWSMRELEIALGPGESARRRVTLQPEVSLPGWHAADLHVHTRHSDDAHAFGGVVADALVAEGISLAAVTDHNAIHGLEPGIEAVAGAELTTWAPEVGHFNAFPLRSLPAVRGTDPARLFAELKRDPDVFVQINHPRLEAHIAYFELGGLEGTTFAREGFSLDAHGIELWNGYDIERPAQVTRLLQEWRALLDAGHRLTATAGSDCHGAPGHAPGYPRTYVQASRAEHLAPALKAGRAFVSNGPLLGLSVQGKGPGETAALDSSRVQVEVQVLAPSWMRVERVEIWAGASRVWSRALERAVAGPLRFRAKFSLALGEARFLHAVARGGDGVDRLLGRRGVEPLAFTNPVYLQRFDAKAAVH